MINNIEKFLQKNNITFFSYAWREKINETLTTESKYSKLVDWINEEIENQRINLNVFNPVDKTENYLTADLKIHLRACQNIAFLLNSKWIILDNNCTTKMRANYEYTICKLFNIKYNAELGVYV